MRTGRAFSLVVAFALSLAACDGKGDRTGIEVLPGMARSVPYDAFAPNPVTGATLLAPPEGTVPVDAEPFPFGPDTAEAARAGRLVMNPLAATPADLSRGMKVYETFCIVCHGPNGEGDGPIIGRYPNPPSLLGQHARSLPEGRMFHIVTHGQGLMPPYRVQIRPIDRWRAIAHVRQLQNRPATPPVAAAGESGGGTR